MFYECQAIYRHSSILITDISVNRIVNKEGTFLVPCSQSRGIAAATSHNTEEDSLPTSSVSQSLSVTTPSSPSHQVKRSASVRFAKAAKGTPNKMALMQQGYRNYMAKRKLDFENITDENEPPSKRNTRSTQVSTAVTSCLQKNFIKSTKRAFMLIIGNIKSSCL